MLAEDSHRRAPGKGVSSEKLAVHTDKYVARITFQQFADLRKAALGRSALGGDGDKSQLCRLPDVLVADFGHADIHAGKTAIAQTPQDRPLVLQRPGLGNAQGHLQEPDYHALTPPQRSCHSPPAPYNSRLSSAATDKHIIVVEAWG